LAEITVDVTNFKALSILATKRVLNASERGMKLAVLSFMDDCLKEDPACPQRSGAMAASHSGFVDNKLVGISHVLVTGKGKATPLRFIGTASKDLVGSLVVHKPYAAAQHEGSQSSVSYKKYTKPGTGKKWVESKLLRHFSLYFSMIASEIKKL